MTNTPTDEIRTELPDRTAIVLRPVRPEDKPLLAEGMSRLSERSRHMRFLVPTERLSRSQLAYLTEVDQRDHQAWGVLVEGKPVAVARLVRLNEDEGEVAITVVDSWQRRGIGELLIRFIASLARDVGISRLIFVSHPDNEAVGRLLARFDGQSQVEDGLVTTTVEAGSVPPPAARLAQRGDPSD